MGRMLSLMLASSGTAPQHPHRPAGFHHSQVMNNHPNEWREIGLALNTHVLKLGLIKPPSVQGVVKLHAAQCRELAEFVHGPACSLSGWLWC